MRKLAGRRRDHCRPDDIADDPYLQARGRDVQRHALEVPYTTATTTVNLSASIGGSPVTAGPYTVPTTGTLTTGATFLPSSAWTITASSGALAAPAQTLAIPTLAGYPTTSAATVAIAFPDTTITVKKRTTTGCTTASSGITVNVSGGPDSLLVSRG